MHREDFDGLLRLLGEVQEPLMRNGIGLAEEVACPKCQQPCHPTELLIYADRCENCWVELNCNS